MDSAEQAALSEHDSSQTNSQTAYRQFDGRHLNDFVPDGDRDGPRSMKRFEDIAVNLTHSSTHVPSGVDIKGKTLNITRKNI